MFLRNALIGFGCSAIFLAACSGGGGGTPGPSATTAPTATPTASPSPSPAPCPTSTNTGSGVLICQSSATNVKGYYVLLQTSGAAMVSLDGSPTTSATASASYTAQLFSDLNANTPVVDVTTYGPCTKSASFGTSTTVTYEGYTTGDISCPAPSSPAPVTTIYTDVQNVESSLGLTGQ